MARTKLLNGKPVQMTPEEEVARDAEEAAWATRVPPPIIPTEMEILRDALMNNAVITQADLDAAKTKLTA